MMRPLARLLLLAAGILLAGHLGMSGDGGGYQELRFEAAPPTLVDAVWQQAEITWTHRDGLIQGYPSGNITAIEAQPPPPRRSAWAQFMARWWRLRWRAFKRLNTHRPLGRNWPPRHLDYLLAAIGGLLCLAALTLLRGGRRIGDKKVGPIGTPSSPPDSAEADRDGADFEDALPDAPPPPTAQPHQEQVVAFFLQLFQAQCAPGQQAKASYGASGAKGLHGTAIYDLRVRVQGKTHRRRMSIGPLGPDKVGASRCFFVIYDLHLVVKLPRRPVYDYAHYIESIDRERQIAALLGGVPVIAPRVTPILENVHRFSGYDTFSAEAVEKRYIGWMRRNPAFQRYLKIGESFAFFMELSSHHFLHHVFDEIHLSQPRTLAEIRDHGHLIWKPHEFIGRYGAAAQPVCAQLQGVYQSCRRALDLPAHPGGHAPQVTDYQYKKDFLAALCHHMGGAGTAAATSDDASLDGSSDGSPEGPPMHRLLGEQKGVLHHYRRTLRRYLRKTLFLNYRQHSGAIVANTLALTAWLYDRRIALRDLKPENLLVVGDGDDCHAFLKRRSRFQLGLIDLETATAQHVEGGRPRLLSAPKPGGTPLYATPSHFLTYEVLRHIYPEPFEVLMEQDWYAAIAISFRTVTGEHLWDGTAGLFPAMVEMIAGSDPADDMEAFGNLFGKLSWVFWSNARMEFYDKLRRFHSPLSQAKVDLSNRCVAVIRQRIEGRIQHLKAAVTALTNDHAELDVVARHLQLSEATSEQIRLLRTTWEMDATSDGKTSLRLSERFRELEGLTQNLETLAQGSRLLEDREEGVDLLPLLKVLFAHSLGVMYKGGWKGLGHRRIDWHEALMDEPSYTQTL